MMRANYKGENLLNRYQKYLEIGYVILCGCFFFVWSLSKDLYYAPYEIMRYQIPEYIFNHGVLPRGDIKELIDNAWGFSYAFYPNFLGPILSAFFMKIVSFFTVNEFALLVAARFTSVLSGMAAVFFLLKICGRLFSEEVKWLVTILFSLLPQFIFLSSYVNNDIICTCGSAIICYAWICGLQDGWNYKNAVILAIGIIVDTLSYYNSYGWILCSFFLFIFSYVLQKKEKRDYKEMFRIGCFIAAIVIVVAAGFFIRNAILYQGDFLGMKTLTLSSEKFAIDDVKPSNRYTPLNRGMSLYEMLDSTEWTGQRWIPYTIKSFIGVFGAMSVFLPDWIYNAYYILATVCAIGFLGQIIMWVTKRTGLKMESSEKTALFYGSVFVAFCIPIGLSLYYSFSVDYQAQGRYCYPSFIALAVMLGTGIEWYFSKLKPQFSFILSTIVSYAFIAITILAFVSCYLPS